MLSVSQFHDIFGWIRYMLDKRSTVLSLMDEDLNEEDLNTEKGSTVWSPNPMGSSVDVSLLLYMYS